MEWFEIVKTIVQLSLSIGSLSLSIAILKWTRRARARIAGNVVDLVGNEIKKIADRQETIMKSLNELQSKIKRISGDTK